MPLELHQNLPPLTSGIIALLIGCSRAALPLHFLQCQKQQTTAFESGEASGNAFRQHWQPVLAHFAHNCAAIAGIAIVPILWRKRYKQFACHL